MTEDDIKTWHLVAVLGGIAVIVSLINLFAR